MYVLIDVSCRYLNIIWGQHEIRVAATSLRYKIESEFTVVRGFKIVSVFVCRRDGS